jgi:hypothetical protein
MPMCQENRLLDTCDFEGRRITSPLVCYTTLESLLDLRAEPVEKFGIIALNSIFPSKNQSWRS